MSVMVCKQFNIQKLRELLHDENFQLFPLFVFSSPLCLSSPSRIASLKKKPYFSSHNPIGELGEGWLEDEETIMKRTNNIYRVQNLITSEVSSTKSCQVLMLQFENNRSIPTRNVLTILQYYLAHN